MRWYLLHCSRCPTALRAVSLCAAAGSPLELVQPETLRWKAFEPVLLLGKQRFSNVDIRIRVKVRGGCDTMGRHGSSGDGSMSWAALPAASSADQGMR